MCFVPFFILIVYLTFNCRKFFDILRPLPQTLSNAFSNKLQVSLARFKRNFSYLSKQLIDKRKLLYIRKTKTRKTIILAVMHIYIYICLLFYPESIRVSLVFCFHTIYLFGKTFSFYATHLSKP